MEEGSEMKSRIKRISEIVDAVPAMLSYNDLHDAIDEIKLILNIANYEERLRKAEKT